MAPEIPYQLSVKKLALRNRNAQQPDDLAKINNLPDR